MSRRSFDFAVVGAGLVGSAVAHAIAKEGHKVCLLDEGDHPYRASSGNFALVWLQGKGLGMTPYANWSRESVDLWREFADGVEEDAGMDIALQQPGGFQLALSDAEMERLCSTAKAVNAQPGVSRYDYEVLDADEVRRRLPAVGPEVVGATFCELDGHVNALRLYQALHRAAITRGVEYLPRHRVERIEHSGAFRLLMADGRAFDAERIVLAAGLDNVRLAPMIGLDVPVRPQRGQILVTEKIAPFLFHPVSTLRQTDEGSVMLGDSQEEAGFDDRVGTGIMSVLADRACRMFPRLGAVSVVRSWACLRVLSRDGYPIYEQSQRFPGAFVATCHSGVTLAAAHGKVLASAIVAGALPAQLKAFDTGRFHVPAQ